MTKALLVDDSATMRKIILRSLNAVGVTDVDEAGDGDEGGKMFTQAKYDVVLTDWNMPVKTGLDLVKEIRQHDAQVPIIMITTEGEKTRVLEAVQAGISDYLLKPFDNDDLRGKLEKLCS